jgi:hypothetical protein
LYASIKKSHEASLETFQVVATNLQYFHALGPITSLAKTYNAKSQGRAFET